MSPDFGANTVDRSFHKGRHPVADWLEGYLAEGPKPVAQIVAAGAAEGFTRSQIDNAKFLIDARSPKMGVWALNA